MNEQQALRKMVSPRMRRRGIWRQGVMQICLLRSCDQACFNCTQGSNLRGKPQRMSVDQFAKAVDSLGPDGKHPPYFGVVGIFGGNPALHPQFEQICEVLRNSWVPKEQRGIWCNNPFGKAGIMRETFNPAHSNLNVHLSQKAYDEFARDWPECERYLKGHDTDSRHSPVFVSMSDVIDDKAERWRLISGCDINREWSAYIATFRGELRAWFCEIAGAQARLHEDDPEYPDTGLPVTKGWWRQSMQAFAGQVRYHCHRCGVPLRGHGQKALGGTVEQTSREHWAVYLPKIKGRPVQIVEQREDVQEGALKRMTAYIENGRAG